MGHWTLTFFILIAIGFLTLALSLFLNKSRYLILILAVWVALMLIYDAQAVQAGIRDLRIVAILSFGVQAVLIVLVLRVINKAIYLKLILVALAVLMLVFIFSAIRVSVFRANDMRNMQARIPQAIEIFEQSREQFDTLVNSELVARGVVVARAHVASWQASWRGGSVLLEDLDRIEWVSDEERDAIIFLVSSDELEYNFGAISSRGSRDSVIDVRAQLFQQGDAILLIRYRVPYRTEINYIDLGDGYILWLIRPAISVYGSIERRIFAMIFISFAIAATAIKWSIVLHKEKQKEKAGQDPGSPKGEE